MAVEMEISVWEHARGREKRSAERGARQRKAGKKRGEEGRRFLLGHQEETGSMLEQLPLQCSRIQTSGSFACDG